MLIKGECLNIKIVSVIKSGERWLNIMEYLTDIKGLFGAVVNSTESLLK
jgi:hypothetical protein